MKQICTLFIMGLVCHSMAMSASDTLKILGLGNSFTEDAMYQELMPVCKAADFPVTIAYPYKGGSSYAQHVQRYQDQEKIYNYKKWVWGTSTISTTGANSFSVNDALKEDQWDIVIFQQKAQADWYTYSMQIEYLPELMQIVNQDVPSATKWGYYMYWADSRKGTNLLSGGQVGTWDTIKTTCGRIMNNFSNLDFLIPVGTAIQNARTSFVGDNFNRDTHHLSLTHGRYIAALTWYEVLSGQSCIGITYHPMELSDYAAEMCQHAAHNAVLNPYQITDLSQDYGKDESQGKTLIFDFLTNTSTQLEATSSAGYTVAGYTLYAGTTATPPSTNGLMLYEYGNNAINKIKIASVPKGETTKFRWKLREGSQTTGRTWTVYYYVTDAGTDISTIDILNKATGTYYTIVQNDTKCDVIDCTELCLDFSEKTKDQDVYFIQDNTGSNNLGFQTLQMTLTSARTKDTNAQLAELRVSDWSTNLVSDQYQYQGYASIDKETFDVYISPASRSTTATVYQDGQEVMVSAEPGLYILSTPEYDANTEVVIYTQAEDSASFAQYQVQVTGAVFKKSFWDLKQAGNSAQQTSILNGQNYVVDNMALKLLPASSDCNFGNGNTKAYGLYVRAASAKYGDCGFRLELPGKKLAHLAITMCPGANDVTYSYFGILTGQKDTVPKEWYHQTSDAILLGQVVKGLKGQTHVTNGNWIDLSNHNQNQYIYIFHTGGGARYQGIEYVEISLSDPTCLNTTQTNADCLKVIKNDRVLLYRNGQYYTLMGQQYK